MNESKRIFISVKGNLIFLIKINSYNSNYSFKIFRVRKTKSSQEAKKMVCDCSTSQQERSLGIPACGDDCLNRLLMIECGARCPCGEFCTNRNFKTKNNASVQPFRTEFKGWGLRTLSELKT